jgi:serine/threonine-protein kinase
MERHSHFEPDNVMVGRDGRVRVLDFGLAKSLEIERDVSARTDVALGSGSGSLNLTTTGTVMGTPRYMAPEQFRGDATDWRSPPDGR